MGYKIITNNKDSWELFSSITDSVIFKSNKEEELVNFLALEHIYEGKLKAIEVLLTFPNRYTINDERMFNDKSKEKTTEYYNWIEKINNDSKTYEEYYKKIDDKLEELLNNDTSNNKLSKTIKALEEKNAIRKFYLHRDYFVGKLELNIEFNNEVADKILEESNIEEIKNCAFWE